MESAGPTVDHYRDATFRDMYFREATLNKERQAGRLVLVTLTSYSCEEAVVKNVY